MDVLLLLLKLLPIILIISVVVLGYVKAPPDEAYIISGFRHKTIIGKSSVRIPFLERVDKLSLNVMTVDVKTDDYVPTNDFINVKVDAVVKIEISDKKEMLEVAARNFLNKPNEYIIAQVKDVLEGNLREIIGQLTLANMVQDRKEFGDKVQYNAVPDLEKMGLVLVAFNIQSFKDESGVIQDLGIDNISQIKKDAEIAAAESRSAVDIASAQAVERSREKEILMEESILEKEHKLELRRAELLRIQEAERARSEISYETTLEQERKRKEEMTADANLMKAERNIEVQKAMLDAEEKQQADVSLYKRQKEAEAQLFEEQKRSEAVKIQAKNDSEAIRLRGKAEAESIELRGLAEAKSIDEKAKAMTQMGQASMMEMYLEKLPEVAKNVASPLNNVDSIKMYGDGNNTKMISDITQSLNQITDGVSDGLGFDVKSAMLGAFGHKMVNDKVSPQGNSEIIIPDSLKKNLETINNKNSNVKTDDEDNKQNKDE